MSGKHPTVRRSLSSRLAAAIAEDLFVNGSGVHAERLVMLDLRGQDIGGWSRSAVEARVKAILGQVMEDMEGRSDDHS